MAISAARRASGVGLLLAAHAVGVGLGDRGVALGLGLLGQPLRLGLALARLALGVGLGDGGLLGGDRLGDGRRALDLGDARLAQRLEVAVLVADVADGEGVDAQPHVGEVAGRDLLHLLRELVAVLVDVLDRQRAEDGAQVALHRLQRDLGDLLRAPCRGSARPRRGARPRPS